MVDDDAIVFIMCVGWVCVWSVNSAKSDYKRISTKVGRLLIIVTTYWIPTCAWQFAWA